MSFRSAATAAALLAGLAACKPSARGRCSTNTDCRAGAYCASGGICLAQPTTPPAVTIVLGSSTLLSAQLNQVKVHVDADPLLALHGLTVEVDSDHPVASGSIAAATTGDDTVALGGFEANFVGAVTVHATLSYRVPGNDADSQVEAAPAAATMDTAPPSVTVSVPVASDASPNGWVPRTSGNLEVRARVDDGTGSGPASATLSLDTCPAGGLACTYAGSVFSHSKGTVVFSFQVPRAVQAQGSEAPIAVTVSALDAAGNQGKGAGTLQIDDAPPKIGSTALVTAGVTGEDGNPWFRGGSGAPSVVISVPVSDLGSGVLSLALLLDSADVASGTPLNVAADSSGNFHLPASAVQGQGKMRFTLTATDNLQHTSTLGPDDPSTFILVDALPPTVTTPVVDYAHATPSGVCGPSDSSTFFCGRQANTHLLRDDSANVFFDVYDCGAGIAPTAQATITSASVAHVASVTQTGSGGMLCANGSLNPAHHFKFPLDVSTLSALDPPDATGTSLVQLAANASDLLGHPAASPSASAQVSLWRWKEQLTGNITGSPALLAAVSGPRVVVVGTDASSGPNVFALGADGTQVWSATAAAPIGGDVAVGSDGTTVYVVAPTAGLLSIVASQGTSVQKCGVSGDTFGATFAIASVTSKDQAFVVAPTTSTLGAKTLYAFQQNTPGSTACTQIASGSLSVKPTGASAGAGDVFISHADGFSSFDTSFGTENDFQGPAASALPTLAPPSIWGSAFATASAVFGTAANADKKVYKASQGNAGVCAVTACWQPSSGFPTAAATSGLPFTPVFDGTNIFTADDSGTVYGWSFASGTALSAPWPLTPGTGGKVSPPVLLLQNAGLLVVYQDGSVKIISPAGAMQALGSVAQGTVPAFSSTFPPTAPAVDKRDVGATPGGIAYIPAASGWIYAWQIPAEPMPGSATVWPRPGHDSCNSRNNSPQGSLCP